MEEILAVTKHSINSDLDTPLNKQIEELLRQCEELSQEEKTLINSIISKLDNSTYGLPTIKTTLNTVNNNVNSNRNTGKYPNVTYGFLNGTHASVRSVSVSGKGKITLFSIAGIYDNVNITLDGTSFNLDIGFTSSTYGAINSPVTLTFENSFSMSTTYTDNKTRTVYLIQTV